MAEPRRGGRRGTVSLAAPPHTDERASSATRAMSSGKAVDEPPRFRLTVASL
jgi:hypothetical protein